MVRRVWFGVLALSVGLLVADWPVLAELARTWWEEPRYSYGMLVPIFSAYLLWSRRAMVPQASEPLGWVGVLAIAVGAAMRVAGLRYHLAWLGAASLLPCLAGMALLLGGVPALRWSWPSIAFLVLMIPLPWRAEFALGGPLQDVATRGSVYALQTLGQPAFAEGNIIHIEEKRIGVVEACNGLGMMMMFFAFTIAVALVIRRPLLDRLIVVASAVPIAIVTNIGRITATGVLYRVAGGPTAEWFYHEFAGLLMMPAALVLLGAELLLLSRLFVEEDEDRPRRLAVPFDMERTAGGRMSATPANSSLLGKQR